VSNWRDEASAKLGVELHDHANGEMCGPCPSCGGFDRYIVFRDGNAWCRQCGRKDWWIENRPSAEEIERRRENRVQENLALIARMHDCTDWIRYHDAVRPELWLEHGFDRHDIDRWGLGYCDSHPWMNGESSLTIPVFYHGKLVDIRHRMLNPGIDGKYRSHLPGMIPSYFLVDACIGSPTVYVVEGEKKAMHMHKCGYRAFAIPGINFLGYMVQLVKRDFTPSTGFIFIADPSAEETMLPGIRKVAELGNPCYLVESIGKPDDLLQEDEGILRNMIRFKRRIR